MSLQGILKGRRRPGWASRRGLVFLQRHESTEMYLDDIWLARTREEYERNMTRRARFYGHRTWKLTIKPFFEKWLGVQ
jgi:hypothetical protein